MFGLGECGGGVGGAEGGFDEGWCGSRELRGAGCEEHQAGGVEPVAEHVDGEDGIGVVTPMGEAGGGELVGRGSGWVTQGVAFLLGEGAARQQTQPGLNR